MKSKGTQPDEVSEETKPGMKEKFNNFKNKFYLDRHHTAQRRGALATVALSLLVFSGAWATIGGHYRQIAKDNQVTALASNVAFSKTAENLSLTKTYVSKDHSLIYVPFTFSDLSQISTNANNYTVSVLDATGKVLSGTTGHLVIFGNTGHATIVLKNAKPFGVGPVRIILRNDKTLNDPSQVRESVSDAKAMQALSKKYDIASFVINPGAEGQTVSPEVSLDSSQSENYKLLFGEKDLKENAKAIKADDKKLEAYYNRATEYRHRLEAMGFEVPDTPDFAKRDYVPKESDNSSNMLILDDIKNKEGKTTAQVSSEMNQSSTNTSSSNTPSSDWSQLTTVWQNIGAAKIDKYITLGGQRKQIEKTIADQNEVASISKASKFGIAH